MDKSVLLQKQCRDNSEDLRTYLQDLMQWEEEMKRKESELNDGGELQVPIPSSKSKKIEELRNKTSEEKSNVKKIKSYDYAAWDKFDVDAECARLDKTKDSAESEDEEPSEEYKTRLRDEANYEKDRGNQFVKNKKWDEAIACYTHSIACYSKDPIYFANRALCFLKKNDLHSAEADCTSALQLEPTYVKALQRRAAAREGLKQLKEAVDDLKKVLEIEPHNKEAKLQLEKIEKILVEKKKPIDSPAPSTSKEYLFPLSTKSNSKTEIVSPKPSTSKDGLSPVSSTIINDKKNKCTGQSEEIILEPQEKQQTTPKIFAQIPWPERLSSEIILPVQKLPHQRSKKPLRRIVIEESDTNEISMNVETGKKCQLKCSTENSVNFYESNDLAQILTQSSKLNIDDILNNIETDVRDTENKQKTVKTGHKSIIKSKEETKEIETVTESTEIFDFPVPKSSVQFYSNWKIMKNSNQSKFNYIKQIDPKEIPSIFKDSMESDALSDIIFILSKYFIEEKLPVYKYLYFLSNIKRFSALTMFMSMSDKTALQNLFDYCESSGEVPKENLDNLKIKYEL